LPKHTNRSNVCSRKTFHLNGFNIKHFAQPYVCTVEASVEASANGIPMAGVLAPGDTSAEP